MRLRLAGILVTSSLAILTISILAVGQQLHRPSFRINSDIYTDESKPPISSTLTLFSEGVYYDFQESDSGLITIFDPKSKRIIKIDPNRKVRVELNTDDIQNAVVTAQQVLSPEQVKTLLPVGEPIVTRAPDEVLVKSDIIQYRATLIKPDDVDISRQYADFADWSKRLDAVLPPKNAPYLRLRLNQAILAEGAIPKEIRLTTKRLIGEDKITCQLLPVWQLSKDDEARIARAQSSWFQTTKVSLDEYLNPTAKAAQPANGANKTLR